MNTTNESLDTLSGLLADNVRLQRQGMENQQKIIELTTQYIELSIEYISLHSKNEQLEAAPKQQTPTPSVNEKNKEPSENQHLTALGKNSTI